jgi:O-antigen ligase
MMAGSAPGSGLAPLLGGQRRAASGGSARPSSVRRLGWSTSEPSTSVLATAGAAIALTPLVSPKSIFHGAPIDLLMAAAIFAVFVWALRTRAALRVPYVFPTTALILLGLLAALISASPMGGVRAGVQEVFLFCWCAALATLCRTPRSLGILLRVWALSAAAWAVVLIVAVIAHVPAISGAAGGVGTRARLFFDHPNMAGNYFMIAIFIALASGYPRRILLRSGICLVLVVAMFFTGSNAALLSLVGGGVVALFLHLRARKGIIRATAVVAMVVAVLGIGWFQVATPLVEAAQQSDNPLLRYSVGRGERSAEARGSLFASQFEIFEQGNWLGIGPAGTRAALGDAAAATVKEAHNDYLATLNERGVLGALALVGLIGAVTARAVRVTKRPPPDRIAAAVPHPAALVGACAAFALTAVTHEVLHYRWLWSLFAMLAALYVLMQSEPSDAGAAPPGSGSLVPVEPRVR